MLSPRWASPCRTPPAPAVPRRSRCRALWWARASPLHCCSWTPAAMKPWRSPTCTTAQTTLAEASTHTRLRNITVEYLQDVHDTQLLAAPSYEAEAVEVSCASCAHGVTFAPGASSGLQVVSPPRLMCEQMAFLNRGTTARCRCSFPEQVPDPSYGHEVQVSETGSYCRYCRAHFEARDENCSKCPLYKAGPPPCLLHLACELLAFRRVSC